MGIAWNKNCALFLLAYHRPCDAVVLLEDDFTQPSTAGSRNGYWRASAGGTPTWRVTWLSDSFLAGTGTVDDPILSINVSAQCSSFSHAALLYGGYFDSRFRGYGQEHVEHTRRLLRVGYGGSYEEIDGEVRPLYKLLKSSIAVTNPGSFPTRPTATATC